MSKSKVLLLFLLLLPSLISAQPNTSPVGSAKPEDQKYRIGTGDILEIRVFNKPQFSRDNIRVGSSGGIRMPFLKEDVKAVCKTEQQLADEITELYKEYLRSPQVDVFVKEFNSQPVAITGAVRQPSRFQLRSRVRLLELMPLVGGLTEKAGPSVQVMHTVSEFVCEEKAKTNEDDTVAGAISSYELRKLMSGDEKSNPYVRPGDIVSIAEAESAFIVGNVYHPSEVLLKEPITVTRAIAMAGGVLPDSKTDKIRIQRQTSDTEKTEIFVDIKAINKKQAPDVLLQAGDIVDVPTAQGKRFIKSLFGSLPNSLTQLPLRVVP